jgi:hypothetical protein
MSSRRGRDAQLDVPAAAENRKTVSDPVVGSCEFVVPREAVRAVQLTAEATGTVTLAPGCDDGGQGYVLSEGVERRLLKLRSRQCRTWRYGKQCARDSMACHGARA